MSDQQNEVVINEKSMEILVAKFIPTSQYFERSFLMLQNQLSDNKLEQKEFKKDVNERFKQVDKRFEQVDKRFEQVDKRFEQVDATINEFKKDVDERFKETNKNIMDLTLSIQDLSKNMEVTIRDHIIDRDRLFDAKLANLRMFNIATISLVAGVILKMAGFINF